MNKLTLKEKVQIANLFNKIGAINTYKMKRKGLADAIMARVLISSNDKEKLCWLTDLLGMGPVQGPYKDPNNNSFWRISINRKPDILEFLEAITPYLSAKRQIYVKQCLSKTKDWTFRPRFNDIECPHCKKLFKYAKGRKYCSRECAYQAHTIEKATIPCACCEKPVQITYTDLQYRKKTQNCSHTFCNWACYVAYRNRKTV